ncbi:MAG: cell division protein FtsQ/DivIB [Myxococcota bacterium]
MRARNSHVLPSNRRISRAPDSSSAASEAPPSMVPPSGTDAPARGAKARWWRRRATKRWAARLSLATGVTVVFAASILVAWGLRRYLRSSPRFSLRTIVVEGNERLTDRQVAARGQVEEGVNLFVFDEALATVEDELYLVDSRGDMFKDLREGDPHDLPIVSGITTEEVAKDREAVRQRVVRALALMVDLERAEIAKRFPIQELHISADLATEVTIGTDGITLVFGQPPYRSKVAKASRILEELRFRKVGRAVMFLDNVAHPERVVVRML